MKASIKQLLHILLEEQPKTAASLADDLHVSVRTVKNYVKEINTEYPDTIRSSYKGYSLDSVKALAALSDSTNHIPQTSHERVVYIVRSLINHNQHIVLDMYDLCDELFVSMSTLKNELYKVRRQLKKFDLQLQIHGDTIECIGLEKNKRKMLSSILYDESNINFVNIDSLQRAFIDIDIRFIRQAVLEIFDKYHYFINDYSLINLVLHITIAIDRIRNQNMNAENIDSLPGVRLHEFEMAGELAKKMEEKFKVHFSNAEIYEMTLLIISRATTIDYKSINEANLEQFIGSECMKLVRVLIDDVNAFYYIDLSEPEFFIRFALHIRNLLVRSKNDYFSKNPLTDSIKVSCPLIYDVSVNMARTIQEQTGIKINDDEIAYIAFHLGSALETQRTYSTKINAALYCPNYYDINQKINDQIKQHFEHELLIKYILTDESELDKVKDIDVVITTIPFSKAISMPFVMISLFLNDRDIKTLKSKIADLQNQKQKKEFEDHLRTLITPELFERKNGLSDQKTCIDYMVRKMEDLGYADETYHENVLERERISSTAFGDFAIPHAMKMYARKTGMFILISEDPITWGKHQVHLIMMMCFNINERYIFNEIYDPITMILSESENIKKLLACQSYEEFIQTMIAMK